MFGISLPSRRFSSQSLVEGEAVMAAQPISEMSESEMAAELQKLEDKGSPPNCLTKNRGWHILNNFWIKF